MRLPFLNKLRRVPKYKNPPNEARADEAPPRYEASVQYEAPPRDQARPANETRPSHPISSTRFWFLSIGICLGLFLSIVDSSIVATSLYTIGTQFGDLRSINWVALAYTLAYLGCSVAFAHVSDVIGRRNAFILAFVLFCAFSLASGFANNLHQLIAFRTIQGIGGSGLYSLTMVILPEACPPQLFKFVGSLIGMVVAASGVLGPVLGGLLTEYTKWRWIFWINGPICFLSVVTFILSWPSKQQNSPLHRLKWKNFDYFGTFLIISASVLVVFAFQNAGDSFYDVWSKSVFIAPLTAGLVCWGGVFIWAFLVDNGPFGSNLAPAFPFRLFKNRYYTSAALTTLLIGYPYLQIVFTFPTRAQVVSGKSVLVSGLGLLPMIGGSAFGSILSGMVNSKKNFLAETITAGCGLTVLGCGLLTTIHTSEDNAKALGYLVFSGLGFGLSTAAATMVVTFEAPIAFAAPAHGILAQMRILGGSIGIATASVLLRTKITEKMGGHISPSDRQILSNGLDGLDQHKQLAIIDAYSTAFRTGMMVSSIIAGVALLVSLVGFRKTRVKVAEQRAGLHQDEEIRLANMNTTNHNPQTPT